MKPVWVAMEQWYPHLLLLMPDHVHGLIAFGENSAMESVVRNWKRYTARHLGIRWQRDFFDHINAGTVFGAMAKQNQLKPAMLERMQKGSLMPGWVRRSEFDWYSTLVDREA